MKFLLIAFVAWTTMLFSSFHDCEGLPSSIKNGLSLAEENSELTPEKSNNSGIEMLIGVLEEEIKEKENLQDANQLQDSQKPIQHKINIVLKKGVKNLTHKKNVYHFVSEGEKRKWEKIYESFILCEKWHAKNKKIMKKRGIESKKSSDEKDKDEKRVEKNASPHG